MRNGLREFMNLGMESAEDGNKEQELEYTFYGHVADMEELYKKAFRHERQEQWLVPIETKVEGKLRIRKVDDTKFLACTKIKRKGKKGQEEVEIEISEDMYNHLREMGKGGTIKTRYFFKIEDKHDMVWEIDVFKGQDGKDHAWVKIDLEVPDEGIEIPAWPIDFQHVITHQSKEQTEEEQSFIEKLWVEEWAELDQFSDLDPVSQ